MTIGQKIKKLRKEKGLILRNLEKAIKIDRNIF